MIEAAVEPSADVRGKVDLDAEFSAYFATRRQRLMRTAYLLTGDHHAAEDLVQTALARVYVAWRRLQRDGAIDAYVRRTMINAHLGLWRRAWRRLEHSTDQVPDKAAPAGERSVVDERVREAIRSLAPRQRAVVVLRYYEDLSEADIADALGCSTGTVKSTAARSLAKLRKYLEENP
jgi:RNA polymerase sigma-70 factor (sigma-E family)